MTYRRIQRQTLIEGWNQDVIDGSLVLNLGKGLPARYATLLASCLEFGRVIISNNERTRLKTQFMGRGLKRGPVAPQLADIVSGLNENVRIGGLFSPVKSSVIEDVATSSYNVTHLGNNWHEKRYILANLARDPHWHYHDDDKTKNSQVIVFGAGNDHELRLAGYSLRGVIKPELLMPQFQKEKSSTPVSLAIASLGIGEIVRERLELGEPLEEVLTWNLRSENRTSHKEDFNWDNFDPRGIKIAVVGCGAVGMMYNEAIHDLGFERVYDIDFDIWNITNFSRAPHCIGETGRLKARATARHFNRRGTKTKFTGRNERFDEDSKLPKVDLIVSCVDGFDNQMRVINYSQRNQIPLLLGGCTAFSSVVYAYVPGKTSSMLYQYDFLRQAYLDSIRQAHPHCTDPDVKGSQVITTSLCAAMLAGETINLFSGHPLKGQFRYDMLSNPRFDYAPARNSRDLGTNISNFEPLPESAVKRIIKGDSEEIYVNDTGFNEWYETKGNVLNTVGGGN